MGFFDRLKNVFTRRKAARANERGGLFNEPRPASAKKASATRRSGASKLRRPTNVSAQRKRSDAWKADRAKEEAKMLKQLEAAARKEIEKNEQKRVAAGKTLQNAIKKSKEEVARNEKKREAAAKSLQNAIKKSKEEGARVKEGENRAAATRKARENKIAAAPNANEWTRAFRNERNALEGWAPVTDPYKYQGSVRRSEKLRSPTKKNKSKTRSIKARENNWNLFATAPPKKEMTQAERNFYNLFVTNAKVSEEVPKSKKARAMKESNKVNIAAIASRYSKPKVNWDPFMENNKPASVKSALTNSNLRAEAGLRPRGKGVKMSNQEAELYNLFVTNAKKTKSASDNEINPFAG